MARAFHSDAVLEVDARFRPNARDMAAVTLVVAPHLRRTMKRLCQRGRELAKKQQYAEAIAGLTKAIRRIRNRPKAISRAEMPIPRCTNRMRPWPT